MYPGGTSGEEDDLTPALVSAYEAAAGRTVAWVYFSHNWFHGRQFPLATATWVRDRGAVPYIRLMLRSGDIRDQADPPYAPEAIARGDLDADLRAWGDAARAYGGPLLVEWGTECNGEWFPWNGRWSGGGPQGPARFRAAFRHVVETIRARGAANITWVWHVNNDDVPADAWNRLENYYPGDDVVDWVGVSVYGAQTPQDADWPAFPASFDAVYGRLAAVAPAKPLIVCEFGVTAGSPLGTAPTWAGEALDALLAGRWPAVRGFSWWNETWQNDNDPAHDTDMRVQAVAGLSAAFQARLTGQAVVDRPIVQ
ncbi:MAG: beta-mannanase [Armatimonadetes bacterium]|nr:beta-mannanase [Armatimonadota bacterium]